MELTGTGIGRGIAIGPTVRMPEPLPVPEDVPSARSAHEEKDRAVRAAARVAEGLRARGRQAGNAAASDVLDAQAMMAEDPALSALIEKGTQAGKTAERSVYEAFSSFREQLLAIGGYLGERAADLDDISQRVIADLAGVAPPGVPESDGPFVLVARDLAPADTATLDLGKVLALVTSDGGPTSHTAILAREKSIVALVGVTGADTIIEGTSVIVDAQEGLLVADPDDERVAEAERRREARRGAASEPAEPGALAVGTAIPLLANLGSPDGADEAVALGAEGVGLFRTEFLFLEAGEEAPTVKEQTHHYVQLLSRFPGRKVTVRMLDAGADKPLAFVNDADEENPALGLRGLRALRANEDVLSGQLEALAAAEAQSDADVWVMAPMVSTVEEVRFFTARAHEAGLATAGIMVETPAIALMADRAVHECDFVSLGTNDLTQYTMAADRLLGSVSDFQSPWNPAVLQLVDRVGRAGRAADVPVGVCGEAAADPLMAVVLVGLGATSLSMSSAALGDVRHALKQVDRDDAERLAALALSAESAEEAQRLVREEFATHAV